MQISLRFSLKMVKKVDRKYITSGVIKRLGKYTANVRLHRDVIVEVDYEVIAEQE